MDTLKKILQVIKVIYGVLFAIAGVVLIFAPKMPDNDTAVTILGAIFCLGIAALLLKPSKKEAPPAKPVQPTPEPVTSPISNNISSVQEYEAGERCAMDKINGSSTNNLVYRVNSKVHQIIC